LAWLARRWQLAAVDVASAGAGGASGLSLALVLGTPALYFFLQPVALYVVYGSFFEFMPAFCLQHPLYDWLGVSVTRLTAWPWACDPNLHLTNSAYSGLCDSAFFAHMHRLGYLKLFMGEGVAPVIGSQVETTLRSCDAPAALTTPDS